MCVSSIDKHTGAGKGFCKRILRVINHLAKGFCRMKGERERQPWKLGKVLWSKYTGNKVEGILML